LAFRWPWPSAVEFFFFFKSWFALASVLFIGFHHGLWIIRLSFFCCVLCFRSLTTNLYCSKGQRGETVNKPQINLRCSTNFQQNLKFNQCQITFKN
jgi:hypothetical protein